MAEFKTKLKGFFRFFISKVFLKNLFLSLVILALIIMSTAIYLNIYTNHGDEYVVPDLTGKSVVEAEKILKKKKFRYQIIDSVYATDFPRGVIISHQPPAKFKVKHYRTIFITVNAFNPEKVKMPIISLTTLQQVKSDLEAAGLKVGKLTYVDRDFCCDQVLKIRYKGNEIATGTVFIKGTPIDLILESNPDSLLSVPKVIGLTKEMTYERLIRSYLNVGNQYFDQTVKNAKDSLKAVVVKQIPEYGSGSTVKPGTFIDVWYSRDKTIVIKKEQEKENKVEETNEDEEDE